MSEIDIFNSLKSKLIATRRDIATNPGTVVADVFLIPQSFIINKNRIFLEYVKSLQTFVDILALKNNEAVIKEIASAENKTTDQVLSDISSFIDNKAADFNMYRKPQTYATGYVYFGRFDAPTFNITIPAGTEVKTLDNKTYKTTQELTMFEANSGDYYDPVENLYLIKVPVKATQAGTAGNTVSYTINILVNQISGINYVLNKDNISNGVDQETDEQFISRIKTKLSGVNTATKGGLDLLIRENFITIKDLVIIDANDSLMVRDEGKGGKVDVYILDETAALDISEEYNAFDEVYGGYRAFYLKKQPVFFDGTEEVVAVPITDYVFAEDLTSSLSNSKFARTLVYFTNTALVPPFRVNYKYFDICERIQDFLNKPENAIIGSIDGSINPNDVTILVKKAKFHKLNIQFSLKVRLGYDPLTVKTQCVSAIGNFVNSTLLGSKISQSDIIAVVEAIDGVDYVDFNGGIFDLDNNTNLETIVSVIKTEYIRTGVINIIII